MGWGDIIFDYKTPLVHIFDRLTADLNVTQVVESTALPSYQGKPNTGFQQGNVNLHVTRQTLNILTRFVTLPWKANSADRNIIARLCDLV
ncbi:hypothetical protein TNCV_388621 [Trichonephila clavipes]|nr:hypothetical protein TNCV_388621 [Trichonephila clavipes]